LETAGAVLTANLAANSADAGLDVRLAEFETRLARDDVPHRVTTSIVYDLPHAAEDGNVMRVVSRLTNEMGFRLGHWAIGQAILCFIIGGGALELEAIAHARGVGVCD
jgi:hypothetical protein